MIDIWKWTHAVDSVPTPEGVKNIKTVHVECPRCKRGLSLREHQISQFGDVTPSLICPHPPCTFHEHIRLAFYSP